MIARHSAVLSAVVFALDAATAILCFFASFYAKMYLVMPDPELKTGLYYQLLAIEVPFVMAALALNGLYSQRSLFAKLADQAQLIAKASIQVLAIFIVVSFYAKLFPYSRAVFTLYFVMLPIGLTTNRALLAVLGRGLGWRPFGLRRFLVVGKQGLASKLAEGLASSPYCAFEFEYVGDDDLAKEDVLPRLDQTDVDGVLLDLPCERRDLIGDVVMKAEAEGISVYLTPGVSLASTTHLSWETVDGHPLIAMHPLDLPLRAKVAKRVMDIVASLAALVLLSPVMLLVAIVVKVSSRGPVLFRQLRLGLDGKPFTMLKFRTMRVDAEKDTGPVWAEENDSRCTPVGWFLRRYNLDELPQFLNVLAGSMSLIGPRPERPELVGKFKEKIDRYAHKHWVKPGITGWAQVNGLVGRTGLEERIRHDIYYMENWSLWLDLWILLKTPLAVLLPPPHEEKPTDEGDGGSRSR